MSISRTAPRSMRRERRREPMAKNRESTAAAEKLSDEALSRQLGRYQRVEAIFMLLCIVSVIACVTARCRLR